jgi:hypothetical protein
MGRSMQTNLIDHYPKVLKNLTEDTTGLTMGFMLSVDGTRTTEWFCKIGREIWEK